MGMDHIPQVLAVQSQDPEILVTGWRSFEAVMLRETALPRQLKEMIAVVVSNANSCKYCVDAHSSFLIPLGFDQKKIDKIICNINSSMLSEKEKEILGFALKVTNESWKITDKDVEHLKEKHWITDREIFEIVMVVGHFNYINRVVNALGLSEFP